MAIYGFFISAPLGHVLVGLLQRAFAGKTGARAKLGQILASNLLVAPVQASGGFVLVLGFLISISFCCYPSVCLLVIPPPSLLSFLFSSLQKRGKEKK